MKEIGKMDRLADNSEPANEQYREFVLHGNIKKIREFQNMAVFFLGCFLASALICYFAGIKQLVGGLPLFVISLISGAISLLFFMISVRMEDKRKRLMMAQHKETYSGTHR
jgi:hypothetical protein